MVKLSPKEQWLLDYVASGPGGRRRWGSIRTQHREDFGRDIDMRNLKVVSHYIRKKGYAIFNIRTGYTIHDPKQQAQDAPDQLSVGVGGAEAAGDGGGQPSAEPPPQGPR